MGEQLDANESATWQLVSLEQLRAMIVDNQNHVGVGAGGGVQGAGAAARQGG